MAKSPKTDPTKDPEFQGVIQHFLKTPPQPFTPKAKKKASRPEATSKKRRKKA